MERNGIFWEMNRYVAFLRGINLGPHKKIGMVPLKELFEELGFKEVRTYLQSGNVVFTTENDAPEQLQRVIHKGIRRKFGFEVPVLVKDGKQVEQLMSANPFYGKPGIDEGQLYYVLFLTIPEKVLLDKLKLEDDPHESFVLRENCAYLYCRQGYGRAKINNNFMEKKLRVTATTRNFKTMKNICEWLKP